MNKLIETAAQAGMELTARQAEQFERYRRLLVETNEKMNLTAITETEEIHRKHFVDSLLVLRTGWIPEGARVVDVGSGAGFPGIPLMILRPDLHLTMIDSLRKRLTFVENVIEELDISQTTTVHGRAEDLGRNPAHREQYDIAVARAVAALPVLMEYTLPFVRTGGALIAWKGPRFAEELDESKKALQALGAEAGDSWQWEGLDMERALLRFPKVHTTPARYPRPPKKIQAKPL